MLKCEYCSTPLKSEKCDYCGTDNSFVNNYVNINDTDQRRIEALRIENERLTTMLKSLEQNDKAFYNLYKIDQKTRCYVPGVGECILQKRILG